MEASTGSAADQRFEQNMLEKTFPFTRLPKELQEEIIEHYYDEPWSIELTFNEHDGIQGSLSPCFHYSWETQPLPAMHVPILRDLAKGVIARTKLGNFEVDYSFRGNLENAINGNPVFHLFAPGISKVIIYDHMDIIFNARAFLSLFPAVSKVELGESLPISMLVRKEVQAVSLPSLPEAIKGAFDQNIVAMAQQVILGLGKTNPLRTLLLKKDLEVVFPFAIELEDFASLAKYEICAELLVFKCSTINGATRILHKYLMGEDLNNMGEKVVNPYDETAQAWFQSGGTEPNLIFCQRSKFNVQI